MYMSLLLHFMHQAYWYCVDFMVNLANRTHTAYPEANTWVLLVLLPGLLALLVGVRVWQAVILYRLRRRKAAISPDE
jgi:ABC-type proline/glycine betaine transport system permease subunit